MKKFISLLATVAMAFSLVSSVVLADVAPTITWTVDDYDEDYGAYPVTISISGLPELTSSTKTASTSGRKLSALQIYFTPSASVGIEDSEVCITGSATIAENGVDILIKGTSDNAKAAYPVATKTTSAITDVDIATIYVSATAGTTLTLKSAELQLDDYTDGVAGTPNKITVFNVPTSTVQLGEGAEEPAGLALTADLIGHYDDRGYIWNANVTKGENEISSFGVEFSAGGDTKTGSIANISALTNKYKGAEFTFQVGLKTTKTLDSATFSIADGGDPITADAPVSK